MKKILIKLVIVLVVLAAIAFGWMQYTLQKSFKEGESIASRSIEVSEMMEMPESEMVEVASGSFTKVDPIHWAEGEVKVIESGEDVLIEFSEDFKAANGPDLYVHLSKEQEYGNAKQGSIEPTLNLGAITSKSGKQVYKVSKTEWEEYNHSILIWCRAFAIHFSHAKLQ